MSAPRDRVTRGFKALPDKPHASDSERTMIAFINSQFEGVIDKISERVRLRTAPGETKQHIATMKNDLRSAAQNAMSAIAFADMAQKTETQSGDTPDATE